MISTIKGGLIMNKRLLCIAFFILSICLVSCNNIGVNESLTSENEKQEISNVPDNSADTTSLNDKDLSSNLQSASLSTNEEVVNLYNEFLLGEAQIMTLSGDKIFIDELLPFKTSGYQYAF